MFFSGGLPCNSTPVTSENILTQETHDEAHPMQKVCIQEVEPGTGSEGGV